MNNEQDEHAERAGEMPVDSITRLLGDALNVLTVGTDLTEVTKQLSDRDRENEENYQIEWAHSIMSWIKQRLKEQHSGEREWEYRAYRESRRNRAMTFTEIKQKLNLTASENQIEEVIKAVSSEAKKLLKDHVRADLNTNDPAVIRAQCDLIGQLARRALPTRND